MLRYSPGAFAGENRPLDDARVVLLPIPYDATASFGTGARHGPAALLAASRELETYLPEYRCDALDHIRPHTAAAVEPAASGPRAQMDRVHQIAKEYLEGGYFLAGLGGEHSMSPPLVQAMAEVRPGLCVFQIDAHADLRDSWQGSPFSHACAARRMLEHTDELVQVGIRNFGEEEDRFLDENPSRRNHLFTMDRLDEMGLDRFLDFIRGPLKDRWRDRPVYLTIDVDGFDSVVMPSTGTPEPGGLSFREGARIARTLCRELDVVGVDVMELSPIPGLHAPDFAMAKLLYLILADIFTPR